MRFLTVASLLALIGLSTQQYCDPALCPILTGPHIACNGLTTLSPSCGHDAQEIYLDPSLVAIILDEHNRRRSQVATGQQSYAPGAFYSQAARMATLQWDRELANIAAANARRCTFGHDTCRNTYSFPYAGQNIAISTNSRVSNGDQIKRWIDSWYAEYRSANPGYLANFPGGPVLFSIGHFTQMVSDRTDRIGCSLVSYQSNKVFVCNYSFSNMLGQPIYVTGRACSMCRTGCNAAYPGLCNTNEVVDARA
uniref:Putative scp-like extracellular protein n=1 Tax=Culex tarsalis TaxID=7177 RepID=A0A1Q3FTQ4_CULTA